MREERPPQSRSRLEEAMEPCAPNGPAENVPRTTVAFACPE